MMSLYLFRFAAILTNCNSGSPSTSCTQLPNVAASSDTLKIILQFVFAIIAVVTVIFIIVSAIRYQVSLGDPQATSKLRNAIVYAAIGLVVTLSAEILVTYTLGKI